LAAIDPRGAHRSIRIGNPRERLKAGNRPGIQITDRLAVRRKLSGDLIGCWGRNK